MIITHIYESQIPKLIEGLKNNDTTCELGADGVYNISGHGIEATATFDSETSTLDVEIKKKPFYVSESRIREGIVEALQSS